MKPLAPGPSYSTYIKDKLWAVRLPGDLQVFLVTSYTGYIFVFLYNKQELVLE